MTHRFQGLNQTARTVASGELPDGIYLVRAEKVQYRWHVRKPFYFLRLSVLEPTGICRPSHLRPAVLHAESLVETGLVPARLWL